MLIREVPCPECGERFIVEEGLWQLGSVALHCPSCQAYFEPAGSPGVGSPQAVANASVPITVWDGRAARDLRDR